MQEGRLDGELQPNVLLEAGPTLRSDQGLCPVGPWKPHRTEMPQLRAARACVTSCGVSATLALEKGC